MLQRLHIGDLAAAVEGALTLLRRHRDWRSGGEAAGDGASAAPLTAQQFALRVLDAAGDDPAAASGRRRLASLLFI